VRFGGLEVNRERYWVTVNGHAVRLTHMEFQILQRIAEAGGKVVRYDELARSIWGTPSRRTRRRLAVLVSRIRGKLGEDAPPIETVRQVGYRLAPARDASP
jgi:two-component system alkaline phosphatase synthesis response regulator PhoP